MAGKEIQYKKIIKRLEKLEAFAQAIIEETTAVRLEIEGNTNTPSVSPGRGKAKDAAMTVLKNRRASINRQEKN